MNKFLTSAAIGIAAISVSTTATIANAGKNKTEKCYGISKVGANDCGSKANGHSCAGHSVDSNSCGSKAGEHSCATKVSIGNPNEFIVVPKGLCERLAGGSLTGDNG